MLNFTLIEQRLALIASYLKVLEELARKPKEIFLHDKTITGAVESYLRRSLEAIFDIGRHILAKSGSLELAMEYKSIARGLKQKGIVDKRLGDKLEQMAGYRNRLVHLYNEVTEEELYSILKHDLVDLKNYIRQIRTFITSKKEQ